MALTVGIDLGTTYSVVAYINPQTKEPEIIKNRFGKATTPSAIGINADGSYVIGEDAKAMEEAGDVNTASFYKLYMGDHNHKINIRGTNYTAMDLSAMFLKRLIEDSEKSIGDKIDRAVITVPAYFEDAARNDTIKAGEAAGLEVLNIISEPTAACVAYGLKPDGRNRKILIYDLGGGTFDVTIAQLTSNSIDVLGTIGHHRLGGCNWDEAIVQWLVDSFMEETGIDISENEEVMSTLMAKAEKAKIQLTNATFTEIGVDADGTKRRFRLTREYFEDLTSYQLGITIDRINTLFGELHISGWDEIDGAVLVGGSTRMPMVKNFMSSKGVNVLTGVNPDEAVAVGAALQANINNFCATLPGAKKKSSLSIGSAKELNLAALPGAVIIRDVISHSLGMISVSEDYSKFVNDIMIKRNTPSANAETTKRRELSVRKNKADNKLEIYLLQGEYDEPEYCTVAKKYVFFDIDYVDGGKTMLDITYRHTINSTIDITAVQTETGKTLKMREEPIPEDMSWVTKTPTEVFGAQPTIPKGVLIMALDVSGSMSGRPLQLAKKAMKNFAAQFSDTEIKIGIVAFSNKAAHTCIPTLDHNTVERAINSIEVNEISRNAPANAGMELGFGNSADPLPLAFELINMHSEGSFAYTIVMTDGVWCDFTCDSAISEKNRFTKMGYEIIGMGFGSADRSFLKKISTKSELAKVDDISRLNENLSSIARIIR